MNGVVFFWVVIIIAMIVINVCFANRMQSIAESKGSKDSFWGWCFLIPIFGALMVIALPDRGEQKQFNNDKDDELPPL